MKLLSLYLDFIARGHSELREQIGSIRDDTAKLLIDFVKLDKEEKRVADDRRKRALEQRQQQLTLKGLLGQVTTGIKAMNLALTGSVAGWTTLGFVGTTHGAALHEQFARLSRGIAAIFVPEMESMIGIVRKAGDWFMNLTGEQQRNIATTVKTAIVFLSLTGAVVTLGPMVVNLVKGLRVLALTLGVAKGAAGGLAGAVMAFAAIGGLLIASNAIAEHGLDSLSAAFDNTGTAAEKSGRKIKSAMDEANDSISVWEKVWGVTKTSAWIGGSLASGGLLAALVDRPENYQEMLRRRAASISAGRKGGGRSDVQIASSGTEAITATIQRLQDAALKQDYLKSAASDLSEIKGDIKQIAQAFGVIGNAIPLPQSLRVIANAVAGGG